MPIPSPEEAKAYAPIIAAIVTGACGFLGALLGGSVLAWVNWYQVRNKGRENLDAWLERYAVTEGIEPLLFFVHATKIHHLHRIGMTIGTETPLIPTAAIQRVCSLVGDETIILVVSIAQTGAVHCETPSLFNTVDEVLGSVGDALERLERFILDTKIKRKSEVFNMRGKDSVKEFNQKIEEISKKLTPIGEDLGVRKAFEQGLTTAFGEKTAKGWLQEVPKQ